MNTYIKIAILALIILVFLLFLIHIIISNSKLEFNSYEISAEGLDGFTIAQVSDLHNSKMAENNVKLLSVLKESEPSIIVITGDVIDSRRTDVDAALELAAELLKIAPCYYVNGNHESRVEEYTDLKDGLTELGVTVLENAKTTIEWQGKTITLVGINDPSFEEEYLSDSEEDVIRESLCGLVSENDGFTILLSHRPEFFEVYAEYGVDLVFSGHTHGGQIRLPLVGGLYAPGQGLFPKYDAGIFTKDGTTMIVSRGVGKSIFPIRVNNMPEAVIVRLQADED